MDDYINYRIRAEVNPNDWWQEHSDRFPRLFKLFKKLSTIPATSASSERDFSHAGNIITDKRSMLLPKSVDDLIMAKSVL